MRQPNDLQMTMLRAVAREGGFSAQVSDEGLAEECVWFGWLMHEGPTGYGLTADGAAVCRPPSAEPDGPLASGRPS